MMESEFFVSPITAIIVILVIVFLLIRRGKNSLNSPMMTLVLTKFQMLESEDSDELLSIAGRKSGLIGWLLTKIGLDAETTIRVTKKELLMKSSSLAGESYSIMTLKNISSSHCGFYKPITLFILAVILVLLGLLIMMFVSFGIGIFIMILGAICYAIYYFNKKIRIMVQTKGGGIFGMCFSPSLIEGIDVDMEKAKSAVELIQKYMLIEQKK